jgi:hypothetical protein
MNPTLLVAVVADALDFPTELDNTFCDAAVAEREAVALHIAEINEAAEVEANKANLLEAIQDYVDMVNRTMEAYETAERNRDHEDALMGVE